MHTKLKTFPLDGLKYFFVVNCLEFTGVRFKTDVQ